MIDRELPPGLWRQLLLTPDLSGDVDTLSQAIQSLMSDLFHSREIDFRSIEPDQVQPEILCALLRASSDFQERAPGWREALGVAFHACLRRGIDPSDALFGMLPREFLRQIPGAAWAS